MEEAQHPLFVALPINVSPSIRGEWTLGVFVVDCWAHLLEFTKIAAYLRLL
jgi:hypothetical protein